MNKNKVQKTLYFNSLQIELGEQKASSLGMSFNDWLKFLVSKEIEPLSRLNELDENNLEAANKVKGIDANIDIVSELKKNPKDLNEADYNSLPY